MFQLQIDESELGPIHFVPEKRADDKIRQAVAGGLRLARENSLRSYAASPTKNEPSYPSSSDRPQDQ